MIKIVQIHKYENTYLFFVEGSNKAMSIEEVEALVNMGRIDLSPEQFNEIVGA
jgi:hypothetical protein